MKMALGAQNKNNYLDNEENLQILKARPELA